MYQSENLESDAMSDGQPVKVLENGSDVLPSAGP